MLFLAIGTFLLASASAVDTNPTPASYRKQRILRAMSSGEAITLRLRGGGGAVSSTMLDRKQRILRAVNSGQAVTEDALLAIEATATLADRELPPTTWDDPHHRGTGGRRSGTIPLTHTNSGAFSTLARTVASGRSLGAAASASTSSASTPASTSAECDSGGRPTRMTYRKKRMLRSMTTGHAVTHAVERGYVSSC